MPAPTVPPAPARLSMMTFWPSEAVNRSVTERAMMSVVLPAVNGTMTRIGRVGYVSAYPAWHRPQRTAPTSTGCLMVMSSSRFEYPLSPDRVDDHVLDVARACRERIGFHQVAPEDLRERVA